MKERVVPVTWCLLLICCFRNFAAVSSSSSSSNNNCTLCGDGSPVAQSFRDKFVPILEQSLVSGSTCADWEAAVALAYNRTSVDCTITRRLSSDVCGCSALQDEEDNERCHLCADGQNVSASLADKPVPFVQAWYGGLVPTCQDWDWLLRGIYEDGTTQCSAQRVFSLYCGCSYFNFNLDLWVLLSRISGSTSLVCSLTLLVHILRDPRKRSRIYNQIILGISSCDFVSSIIFILADIPGATSESFCKAQGFFLQLGFAAMFYNVSLTLFYMLTITQGWTESRIRRKRIYLLGIPFGFGLILACAGIPMYLSLGHVCWLPSIFLTDLFGASPLTSIVVGVVPICVAIASITVMQARIFYFVRQSEQKMLKWRFSKRNLDVSGSGNTEMTMTKREKKVFWQSALYVLSFYITWPLILTSLLIKPDGYEDPLSVAYKISSAASFLWPLQGFFTSAVYFRPRIIELLSNCCSRLKASKRSAETERPVSSTGDPPIADEEGKG